LQLWQRSLDKHAGLAANPPIPFSCPPWNKVFCTIASGIIARSVQNFRFIFLNTGFCGFFLS
jgi:hypothetical protein